MKFSSTTAIGNVSRGKASDCTSARLPVIDLAPLLNDLEKKSNRNTPITTNAA